MSYIKSIPKSKYGICGKWYILDNSGNVIRSSGKVRLNREIRRKNVRYIAKCGSIVIETRTMAELADKLHCTEPYISHFIKTGNTSTRGKLKGYFIKKEEF